MIEIGVVTRPHGLNGQVRVKLFTEDPSVLGRLGRATLRLPDGRDEERRLAAVQPGSKGLWVVRFNGCRHRDQAQALQGAKLLVEREALGELDDDEFYLADTVGCAVQTPTGEELGTVVDIGDNSAQSLLLIRQGARIHNVPAVPPFIVSFDGERLVLELPEGLWEAVAHAEEK